MCNKVGFRQNSQGLLYVLAGVFIPYVVVEKASAQPQHSAISTEIREDEQPSPTRVQSECLSLPKQLDCLPSSPRFAPSVKISQSAVVNVENLQPTAIEFATEAETLQGVGDRAISETTLPIPAVTPLETREAQFDVSDTAVPPSPDTVPYTVEDYVPEPEATPWAEVSAEVATPPDDFIEWRATLWGGVMTDNDLEESITFQNIEVEDSGLVGIAVSRTLTGGNSVKIEGELQLFRHFGRQDHYEGTAALALRWELSPSFSIALLEGVSYATALPEIEDENNTDESHFLNYLALEVEYFYTPKWAIAGRLHHRSGAYGQFDDAVGGSNAYLMGVRHRF